MSIAITRLTARRARHRSKLHTTSPENGRQIKMCIIVNLDKIIKQQQYMAITMAHAATSDKQNTISYLQ